MKKKQDQPADVAALRRQAEERLNARESIPQSAIRNPQSEPRLIHELQVHQIELEMQNEELQRTRAQAEELLAQYTDLYDFAPLGYLTLGEQGLILKANLSAVTLLGSARGALINRPISRFILKEDRDIYGRHHAKVCATHLPESCELRMVKADGTPFWAQLATAAVAPAADGPPVCRIVLSDISARKQVEAQMRTAQAETQRLLSLSDQSRQALLQAAEDVLEKAQELHQRQQQIYHMERVQTMGEIASSLAHEVNQPLAGILSNAQAAQEFLARPHPDLEELGTILSDIIADDKRASGIVQRMRAMLRKETPIPEPQDINGLVREAMALARAGLALHGVAVRVALGDNLPLVRADKIQVEQVILNLVRNAEQAMEGMKIADCGLRNADCGRQNAECGLRILVSTRLGASGHVMVSVRDGGPGIAAEALPRLFEPFYTTKTGGLGLGMGLAICRSIVTAHGGRIWAENHPDGGAVVSFTLPVEEGEKIADCGMPIADGPISDFGFRIAE
jgi:two-component system cell cycle sensor histidine kinase/response regulator CckA